MRSSSVMDVLINGQMIKTRRQIVALLPGKTDVTFVSRVFKAVIEDLFAGALQEKRKVEAVVAAHSDQIAELTQEYSDIMKKASTETNDKTSVAIDLWCDKVIMLASNMMRAKFSAMVSERLDKGTPNRVFNAFPSLLSEEELQTIVDEYASIIDKAILDDKDPTTLSQKDKHTEAALEKFYGKLTAIACEKLFDLEGKPTIQLMDFLKLDAEHQDKLRDKPERMLNSFLENIMGLASERIASQLDFTNPTFNYAVVTSLAAKYNDDYFKSRHGQYTECTEKLMFDALNLKAKIDTKKNEIETKLEGSLPVQEKEKLEKQKKSIEKMIWTLDRYIRRTVTPQEFLAELKPVQALFKVQKSGGLFGSKKEVVDPEILAFVKSVEKTIQDFHSGVAPAPKASVELKKK